jgi:hypothetical protein
VGGKETRAVGGGRWEVGAVEGRRCKVEGQVARRREAGAGGRGWQHKVEGTRRREAGGRRQEAGGRRWVEVGGGRWEVGGGGRGGGGRRGQEPGGGRREAGGGVGCRRRKEEINRKWEAWLGRKNSRVGRGPG